MESIHPTSAQLWRGAVSPHPDMSGGDCGMTDTGEILVAHDLALRGAGRISAAKYRSARVGISPPAELIWEEVQPRRLRGPLSVKGARPRGGHHRPAQPPLRPDPQAARQRLPQRGLPAASSHFSHHLVATALAAQGTVDGVSAPRRRGGPRRRETPPASCSWGDGHGLSRLWPGGTPG